MNKKIDWDQLKSKLQACKRIVLTSHVRPDCDALGSELAMADVLRQFGIEPLIVNHSETPSHLEFIDPERSVKQLGVDISPAQIHETCDALMVLDTSAWIQLGEMADVVRDFQGTKFVLDHHVSEDDLGALVFKDPKSEATGRLVYEAAKDWGIEMTPAMAETLFTAIATDTGWFRFSSVTGDTYRCIGDLLDHGASTVRVYENLFETQRLARVNLRGRILSSTQVIHDGRLAYSVVRKKDFDETGAQPSDTEDSINMTMAISGVEAAILFIEMPSGEGVKVSFRSRSELNVATLASSFGGGGHIAAAGALVAKPIDDILPTVLEAAKNAIGKS